MPGNLVVAVLIALLWIFWPGPKLRERRPRPTQRIVPGILVGALLLGALTGWEAIAGPDDRAAAAGSPQRGPSCSAENPCAGGGNTWHTRLSPKKMTRKTNNGKYASANGFEPPDWLLKEAKRDARAHPGRYKKHWTWASAKVTAENPKGRVRQWGSWDWLEWTALTFVSGINDYTCVSTGLIQTGWFGCGANDLYHSDWYNKAQPVSLFCNGKAILTAGTGLLDPKKRAAPVAIAAGAGLAGNCYYDAMFKDLD